jgi:hypothetical protein
VSVCLEGGSGSGGCVASRAQASAALAAPGTPRCLLAPTLLIRSTPHRCCHYRHPPWRCACRRRGAGGSSSGAARQQPSRHPSSRQQQRPRRQQQQEQAQGLGVRVTRAGAGGCCWGAVAMRTWVAGAGFESTRTVGW